jgi:iron complex outermembrane recepter protein
VITILYGGNRKIMKLIMLRKFSRRYLVYAVCFALFIRLIPGFAQVIQPSLSDSIQVNDSGTADAPLLVMNTQQGAVRDSTAPEMVASPQYEITVVGRAQSLTSPALADALKLKRSVPGGLTITENDRPEAENFKELQKYTPGVYTQSDGGTEVSRISIRGSGIQAEYEPIGLELLLDGIPYNAGDGAANLEDFDLSCIHYAETYRGANAFRYGSYTLGGAMNLVPFTGYSGAPLRVDFETGTYGTVNSDFSLANVRGPYDYYISATERYRTGGRQHSREDIERFFGNFGYHVNGTMENRVYLTASNFKRQVPGELTPEEISDNPLQANPEFVSQDIKRSCRTLRIADKVTVKTGNKRFDAGLVWRYRDMDDKFFYSEESRKGISASGANNAGLTLNLVNQSKPFGLQNISTVGAGCTYERLQSVHWKNINGKRGDSIASYVAQAENVPLYAESQQYLGKNLSIIGGIQAVYSGRQFEDKLGEVEIEEEEEEEEEELNFFGYNPKLGLMYEWGNNVQFFANASRSWQPPSFEHLLGLGEEEEEQEEEEEIEDSASSVRFTKLNAQSAWSGEVGCRGDFDGIEWELSVYRSMVRDELLSINDVHGNILGTMNIPHSIHQGIEAGLRFDLLRAMPGHCGEGNKKDRLLASQCYTFSDFYFYDDPVYHYNRIGGLPVHIFAAGLRYETTSGFYFGPEADCVLSRYPADQANTLYADPYAVFNWAMGYSGTKGLSGYVEIRNAFDKHYAVGLEPTPDISTGDEGARVFEPGLGRAFYCGVQWQW